VPDLATVIRPRLDALTSELLRELAMVWPALSDPAQHARIASSAQSLNQVAAAPLIDTSASTIRP
jgi:hypothetical protein